MWPKPHHVCNHSTRTLALEWLHMRNHLGAIAGGEPPQFAYGDDEPDAGVADDGEDLVDDLAAWPYACKGRQMQDPGAHCHLPHLLGAGKKCTYRTRVWRHISCNQAAAVALAALDLEQAAGRCEGIDRLARRAGSPVHPDCMYYHFDSCKLTDNVALSCEVSDRAHKRAGSHYASSFAMAQLPAVEGACQPDWRLWREEAGVIEGPVRLIAYAGIVWRGAEYMERYAYVKQLVHDSREPCKDSGQWVKWVRQNEAEDASESSRLMVIPLHWVKQPFMVVTPELGSYDPLVTLIDFQGKRFGLAHKCVQAEQ